MKKLHLWLSIPVGLFITIVCLSGAILVFRDEVGNVCDADPFFDTVLKIHRYLLVAPAQRGDMTVGKFIVGVSVLLMVFILISGIVYWWPKNRKALGAMLKISFTGGWNKFWHQLHHAGGMYAVIFLLVMCLTGLTWSFKWYRSGVYSLFGEGEQQNKEILAAASASTTEVQGGVLQGNMANVANKEQGDAAQGESVNAASTDERGSDAVTFHGSHGDVVVRHNASAPVVSASAAHAAGGDVSVAKKRDDHSGTPTNLKGWIYWLHTGKWGGVFSKILYFIAAIIGASLPLTGYYFWLKRKK